MNVAAKPLAPLDTISSSDDELNKIPSNPTQFRPAVNIASSPTSCVWCVIGERVDKSYDVKFLGFLYHPHSCLSYKHLPYADRLYLHAAVHENIEFFVITICPPNVGPR